MVKRIAICTLIIFIGACATNMPKKPPINEPSDDANITLAEAATSISESMQEMAQVEKIVTPHDRDNKINIPTTYNLQKRASVDWSGPITELCERISTAAHYRLRVLGKPPAVPILISLSVKDESLAEILRDIDYQAGKKADIHVYPNQQVVELRYARIYS